jgi:predicted Zn-dependent peptidase
MKENGFWLTLLQNHYLLGDNILTLDEYKVFLNSITTADIKAIAEMYLDTKNYVQVALTPSASPEAK